MLVPALKYQDKLHETLINTCWFNEKYKYFNMGYEELEDLTSSTKDKHQFLSIDNNENICGMIFYNIDRMTRNVCGFNAASFDVNPIVFGRDLLQSIDDIFVKFRFNKLCFGVVIGNSIERTYDRLCKKVGGKVAGYYRKDCILMDGSFADVKVYEIMKEEYENYKQENKWNEALD